MPRHNLLELQQKVILGMPWAYWNRPKKELLDSAFNLPWLVAKTSLEYHAIEQVYPVSTYREKEQTTFPTSMTVQVASVASRCYTWRLSSDWLELHTRDRSGHHL